MIVDDWWTNASRDDIEVILAKIRARWSAAQDDLPAPPGTLIQEWDLNAIGSVLVAALTLLDRAHDELVSTGTNDYLRWQMVQLLSDRPMETTP